MSQVGRFKEHKDYLQIVLLKFLLWTIFKLLAEAVFCFVGFFFFGSPGMWRNFLSSQARTEPTLCALGGEVLTTGTPGKSLERLFKISAFFLSGCARGVCYCVGLSPVVLSWGWGWGADVSLWWGLACHCGGSPCRGARGIQNAGSGVVEHAFYLLRGVRDRPGPGTEPVISCISGWSLRH